MARGRKPVPDEVAALKGNPSKRKLFLENVGKKVDPHIFNPLGALTVPEFLKHPREIEIFRRVVEDYLQRRVARGPDLTQYARWASYLHQWMACKEYFDEADPKTGKARSTFYIPESKHGKRFVRNPRFADMLDLERVLQPLEDKLGLNPLSRQTIIRGLSAMPAAMSGLFGDDPTMPETDMRVSQDHAPPVEQLAAEASPLGFLLDKKLH